MPAVLRIGLLELGPHISGKAQPFLLEFFFGVDDPAGLSDGVFDARLRLVPKKLGIVIRNVAVVTAGLDTCPVDAMPALRVFLAHPLHRVAGTATELVGA